MSMDFKPRPKNIYSGFSSEKLRYGRSALNIFNFYSYILYVHLAFEPYFPISSTIFGYTLHILNNKMLKVGAKT